MKKNQNESTNINMPLYKQVRCNKVITKKDTSLLKYPYYSNNYIEIVYFITLTVVPSLNLNKYKPLAKPAAGIVAEVPSKL